MPACNVLYSSIPFQLSKGDMQYVQAGFINRVLSVSARQGINVMDILFFGFCMNIWVVIWL